MAKQLGTSVEQIEYYTKEKETPPIQFTLFAENSNLIFEACKVAYETAYLALEDHD